MKKFFLTVLLVSASLLGSAQLVDVASVSRVDLSQGAEGDMATISPDGSYAVIGVMGGTELYTVDLASGNGALLTRNGSPFDVTISPDGANVVFRTTTFDSNHLRHTGLSYVNVGTRAEKVLVKPSRHLNAGIAVSAAGITAVENNRARTKSFSGMKASAMPVATINYGHLDITAGGKTVTIDPQGRGSYLWPSISPDGTKVVYCLSGAGTFVCNIDGSDARYIGHLHAARWMGNDMLVAMNDSDNGQQITASDVVVCDLAGNRQVISPEGVIAIYPTASADGSRVAFTTPAGELYVINIK